MLGYARNLESKHTHPNRNTQNTDRAPSNKRFAFGLSLWVWSMSTQRRYLSTIEAAEYFGVHPQTIRNWLRKGKIKAHRSPGEHLYRFDLKELEAATAEVNSNALSAYVERILADAPPLSDEQRTRLAELLRPVRTTTGGAA